MKTLTRTGFVVSLIVLIAFSLVLLNAYYERHQAEKVLVLLQQAEVGSTDRATATKLIQPFQKHIDVLTKDQLGLVFYNTSLDRTKLAPHVEFRIWLTFQDGVLVEKKAWEAVSSSGCVASVTERQRGYGIPGGFPTPPNHKVLWSDASSERVKRIRIENDHTYDETLRHKDWVFNLTCMTRIGRGCNDARVMLPNVVLSGDEKSANLELSKIESQNRPNIREWPTSGAQK